VVRNPDGSTEGKHPRDADVDVMREIHEQAPLLRVIWATCLDCRAGVESEIRKCTAKQEPIHGDERGRERRHRASLDGDL